MLLPVWNAWQALLECHLPLQVPDGAGHPLICHSPLQLPSLCSSLHCALHCPCSHISSQAASSECPEQPRCCGGLPGSVPPPREGPHLHQDLTAWRVLTRGGRLVQLEEERGEEEAGIGRAGGVHGPERELGKEKQGEGRSQGSDRPIPLAGSCSHTCPKALHLHHHLLES